jgi:hypothetical protein
MNFHFLLEAEKCPRRAALRRSHYEELGARFGYPDNPTSSLLIGRITHASVALIASQLAKRGCTSIRDPRSVGVLKELGGYSRMITEVANRILADLSDNPRVDRIREALSTGVRSRLPTVREQVQVLLARMAWVPNVDTPPLSRHPNEGAKDRLPLKNGTHFEVELRSLLLQWRGIADLIQLNDMECVITDFKTGEKLEQHRLQLLVYALLWRDDTQLNPDGHLPSRLVISYPQGVEIIAPVKSRELDELAELLKSRTSIVRKEFEATPPRAVLGPTNCPSCDVRILCRDYWTSERRAKCGATLREDSDDVQVILTRKLGQSTWEAESRLSNIFQEPTKVLLRVEDGDTVLQKQFSEGRSLRLTNAVHAARDPHESPVVRITNYTEPLFDA